MIYLKSITYRKLESQDETQYPFNLAVVNSLETLAFSSPVTFFVGENGSGKSTLLEAIACAVGSITVGSESVKTDKSLASVRKLAQQMRLSWQKRTHRGFFLRAEDFFGYVKNLAQTRQELEDDLKTVDRDYIGLSRLASDLAKMPFAGQIQDIQRRYGEGLDAHSHGEAFLSLFQARFVPEGLYLLDEPEAPLSPIRQLAFIAALKGMVEQDSQFIIATHSPIILAFPEAAILSFDGAAIQQVNYQDLDNVKLIRDFLNNPEAFLRHL